MAYYWLIPFFASFVMVFHKSANIQPSWPHTWLLTHIYSTNINVIIMFFLLNNLFLPFRNPTNRLVGGCPHCSRWYACGGFRPLPSHNSFRPCCSKHGGASRCSADLVVCTDQWLSRELYAVCCCCSFVGFLKQVRICLHEHLLR